VNKAVNIAFAGIRAGMIYEGERRFDLVVRLQKDLVHGVDAIRNLLIPIPGGIQVPLHELADVKVKEGPAQIQREDASRRIVVGFNVRGKDVQTVVDELKGRVEKEMSMADGYYITYGGSFKNLNEAKQRLAIAVPISLLLIFLLLYFAFGSFKQGLLVYTAIPLSAIGGVFALYTRGLPFSISAGVGFIALFGVSVLNGIVLISEFNRLKQKGMNDLYAIVLEGTILRLRPVLMTAFVAALGFLPMAISNGAGAEVQRPLATVVIGGLLLSTFLTLFVLPQLYVFFEKVKVKQVGPTATMLLLLFSGLGGTAPAQTLTLQQTLDSAFKNNLTIKQNRLNADAKKELIKSSIALPQSVFAVDAGQVNSAYKDMKFSLTQNFRFPSVYRRDKLVKQNEWLLAKAGTALSEADVRKEVSRTFYTILLLNEKEKLLSRLDSQNLRYVALAEIKMNKGEISELDKVIAETQVSHIRTQLERLRADRDELLAHLAVITGIKSPIVPIGTIKAVAAGSASVDHPVLRVYKVQEQVAKSTVNSERAAFMPDLSIGYTNQSFRGVGPDNIDYYYNTRFHSVQLSLGIPIFTKGVRSKISAAKLQSDRMVAERELQEAVLQNRKQFLDIQVERYGRLLAFFESSRLPAALRLQDAAGKQLIAGEINFMQWVLLLGQAAQVQTDYIDVLELYNSTIIELNYINAN
jgi:cobalt-zinc-cadmium resistance protein CzcA